ncbi:MAG: hypothetical protein JOZ61_11070 [Verrucomicrobia bacterium]|nr:hypothetical protein [Verrucomicrobiota bacterium]
MCCFFALVFIALPTLKKRDPDAEEGVCGLDELRVRMAYLAVVLIHNGQIRKVWAMAAVESILDSGGVCRAGTYYRFALGLKNASLYAAEEIKFLPSGSSLTFSWAD